MNFKPVSAASITIPNSVDSDSKVLVWLEVGRFKLLVSDKDVLWLAFYRQTHKFY